jgi:hypothetical protein
MLSFSLFVPALVVAGSGNSFRITGTFATIVRDDLTNQRTEFVHLFEDQKNGKRYRLIDGSAPNSHFRSHDGTFSPNRTPGWKGFDTPDFERLIPIRVITEKTREMSQLAIGRSIELVVEPSDLGLALTEFNILGDEAGSQIVVDPDTAHYAPTFGERKVAVLLVNFLDNMSQPGSPSQAQSVFDNQIDDYFREVSYQQAFLTTDVFGWWTLPYTTTRCSDPELYPVSAEIFEEAAKRGVDLTPYDHLVYVFNEPFGIWCGNGAGIPFRLSLSIDKGLE